MSEQWNRTMCEPIVRGSEWRAGRGRIPCYITRQAGAEVSVLGTIHGHGLRQETQQGQEELYGADGSVLQSNKPL